MPLHSSRRRFLAALSALAAAPAARVARAYDDGVTPFVVTPTEVVERMLHLAAPRAGDYLIDLGSGDGRIVIEAARRFGARGLGVDIDPKLVEWSREGARRAGVADRTQFEVRDLFETDLSKASIVTMYLLPEVNLKLRPRLIEQLRPGTRIVSHDYDLGDWVPDEIIDLRTPDKLVGPVGRSKVMLWIVPANVRGRWAGELPQHGGRWQFDIEQAHQLLQVRARPEGGEVQVRGAGLRGHEVTLLGTGTVSGKVWNHRFQGTLKDGVIEGELRLSDGEQVKRLPWRITRLP